jgi:phage repressor protein C with HTH and peptisase S24 domain
MEKGELAARIRQLREILDLNQTDFARNLNIPRTSLINYEKGGAIPTGFLDKLKAKFSVNLSWFMYGTGEPFVSTSEKQERFLKNLSKAGSKQISVYSETDLPEGSFVVPLLDQRLSAGGGSYLPEEDEIKALVHVPAYLSRFGKNIAALTVDGDSMYPTLSRGDMVVCDSCGWSGEGVYALKMSGEGFVKRLTRRPGKLVIISDNPKYPTQEEPEESEDIQIIGRVHCAIKEME